MSGTSAIEWTEATWNPTTGCDRISRGCDNCYALTLAKRLKAMGSAKYQNDGDPRTSGPGFGLTVHPDTLTEPLKWRTPRTVFVNSMSDLFHARVPASFAAHIWAVMGATPQHTYQILTKRPERMARVLNRTADIDVLGESFEDQVVRLQVGRMIFDERMGDPDFARRHTTRRANGNDPYDRRAWPGLPLRNVWLGTSIESDEYTGRADHLRQTLAAIRFISAEPLLGPLPSLDLTIIDWVIVGGESGPNARPVDAGWIREIRDQANDAGVAFFFKQWGGRSPKAGGRLLDGRTWDEYPTKLPHSRGEDVVSRADDR